MDHRWQTGLLLIFFIGISALLGVLVNRGSIPLTFLWKSSNSITASAVAVGAACPNCPQPTIACYRHEDCDDRIAATRDICRNPGTEFSICVNR